MSTVSFNELKKRRFFRRVERLLPDKKYWYLAGPMSGRPGFNYREFDRVSELLRQQGYPIVSPAEFEHEKERKVIAEASGTEDPADVGPAWEDCLARDVCVVAHPNCVGIILLPEWQDSRGARLETFVASELDKPLFEFDEHEMQLMQIERAEGLMAYAVH